MKYTVVFLFTLLIFNCQSSVNKDFKINHDGGFKHFGIINGDYIIIKGSIPGTYNRLIKLRYPLRTKISKINKPNISAITGLK